MNIDNETVYYATCDGCGAYSDDNDEGAYSAEEAEAEARRAGWTVLDAEDGRKETLCPQCRAERNGREVPPPPATTPASWKTTRYLFWHSYQRRFRTPQHTMKLLSATCTEHGIDMHDCSPMTLDRVHTLLRGAPDA